MTSYPLPRGNFIVTLLQPEPRPRFGVAGYLFYEAGFDSIYRAFNYMDEMLQDERTTNIRLWAVEHSTESLTPKLRLLHRTHFRDRSGAQSTFGSDTDVLE